MESMILHLESSTSTCSTCISVNGEMAALIENHEGFVHSALMTVHINDCLETVNAKIDELTAVSISAGPGSYTGLRVSFAIAKGMCYALKIPLITIPTLKAMTSSFIQTHEAFDLYVPMLDARRNEVYTETFNNQLNSLSPLQSLVLNDRSYSEQKKKIAFFGNGAFKMKDQLKSNDRIFDYPCSAAHQIQLANEKFLAKDFDDLAYSVPIYLKPPNITKAKPIF